MHYQCLGEGEFVTSNNNSYGLLAHLPYPTVLKLSKPVRAITADLKMDRARNRANSSTSYSTDSQRNPTTTVRD